MSFLTGFEPTLAAPSIERYFEFCSADDRTDLDSRDGHWSPYPMQRPEQPALLGKTLSALSSLCQIYHDVSAWNRTEPDFRPLGSQQDIAFRMQMFKSLATWDAQLHLSLRAGAGSMAHTYYLKSVRTLLPLFEWLLLSFESVRLIHLDFVVVCTTPPTWRCFALYKNSKMSGFPLRLAPRETCASSTLRKAWK
jgi:hypothetical protein